MRPVKVEFQAFGPYAGCESVDFEAISAKGLFLICGKTGIGKTMILDAMTFALFGKSSGHGRDDFEAMRCTAAEFDKTTYVRFEFENNGDYYLFERRLERKRKKLSEAYNVSQKEDDGVWHTLMENPREKAVNEKAVEIIGLEYEQFRQVIVLPQGQFEKLLTSNSDEKEKILTSIFGEEKWQAIAERFYSGAERRKSELKGIQEKIRSSLLEEDCETIAQLELLAAGKKEQEKTIEEEFKGADYDRIIKEQQEILSVAGRFEDLHKIEEKVAGFEALKGDREAWEKRADNARRAEKVRTFIENAKKADEALKKRKADEEEARSTAEIKKKAFEEATEELRSHIDKEKHIEELKTEKVRYEEKSKDYEGLDAAQKELDDLKTAADKALQAEKKEKKKYEADTEAIIVLQKEFQSLQKDHEELLSGYLAGITGELAQKLEEGRPCPVCGSTEHPHKAHIADNSITKAAVDSKKKEADLKYAKLQEQTAVQEKTKKAVEEKHSAVEKINTDIAVLSAQLENRKKNLVGKIGTTEELEAAIKELDDKIKEYEREKERLINLEKEAEKAYTEAKAGISVAEKEVKAAKKADDDAEKAVEKALKENGFVSVEEAEEVMMDPDELENLILRIADHDAKQKTAREDLKTLKTELEGITEPDGEKCRELLELAHNAREEYSAKKALLSHEINRLGRKITELRSEGAGIEEKIRKAEEDLAFAKRLRGDTGTGLQRYVLGIMFSSVVNAANKMLELVHGGRYRLYRSDERAQGTNKRGLELKVFDKNSEEHEGRFVSTLSGGEKFLVSLALSIGMSTVAQKSGIKIEALFIDEGFGSLDDESIADAMNVLNSIREANGMVGIISHVQILQDQIPSKLRIEEDLHGSHIVRAIG